MQKAFTSTKGTFRSSFVPFSTAPVAAVRPSANRRGLMVQARARAAGVGLFGTKAGMMSYFTADGLCVPATVIALEEGNIVTQVKTQETDGYSAVQTGYKVVPERKVKKPELGHLKKAGVPPMRHLREWRLVDSSKVSAYKAGDALQVSEMFKEGDLVDVAGTTIGKGFQGTIKRWNHKRGMMTHGSKSHREHGSIGASTTPSRVYPGLKMAGHMGAVRATVRKQPILKIDTNRNAIVVKGSVPGKPGAILEVAPAKIVGTNC